MGTWRHVDTVSVPDFVDAALAFAVAHEKAAWPVDGHGVAALLGTELARVRALAGLTQSYGATPTPWASQTSVGTNETGTVVTFVLPPLATVTASLGGERGTAYASLMRTAELLSDGQTDTNDVTTVTHGPGDVGIWPVVAGMVVVGLAQVAVIGYLANKALDVVDRKLSRDADLAKLKAVDAAALAVVQQHVDAEQAAGKQLPLDDASKLALQNLGAAQQTIAKKTLPPLSTPSSWLGDLEEAAVFAALAIGAVMLTEHRR